MMRAYCARNRVRQAVLNLVSLRQEHQQEQRHHETERGPSQELSPAAASDGVHTSRPGRRQSDAHR